MRSARHLASRLAAFARSDRATKRAAVETLLLDRVIRRPIVYTDADGLRYVLYPGENAGAYLANRGNYEVAEVRFCTRTLAPGQTVVDVGANIGLYTLLAAKSVGPDGNVHAFEPEPENARRIRVNLALNGVGNVELFEAAVYSTPGVVELNVFAPEFNAWHSIGRPEVVDPAHPSTPVEPTATIEVPAVTLDDHCRTHAIDRIDLLKVDVEGAELDVLKGARELLAQRAARTILFEASLPQIAALGHAADDCFGLLAEHGYTTSSLTADGELGPAVGAPTSEYGNYVAVAPAP